MSTNTKRYSYPAELAVVFFAYFVTARLGLMVNPISTFATLVWAPTGIALTALLLGGLRMLPAIAAGAFFVNYMIGAGPLGALGVTLGNTLEALTAVFLLSRLSSFHRSLDRIKDVLALIVLGAVLSTLVSASIGVGTLWALGKVQTSHFALTWVTWWLGNFMGDLVAGSFLIAFITAIRRPRQPPRLSRIAEFFALVATVAAFCRATFGVPYNPLGFFKAYFIFPVMLWAALRFKQAGSTLVTIFFSALAIYYTVHQSGPFARFPIDQGLLQLQVFLVVLAVMGQLLAAAMNERETALRSQALLSEISSVLNTSLDYETALSQLAKLLVPALADGCIVDIVEKQGTMKRVVCLHHDPKMIPALASHAEYTEKTGVRSHISVPMIIHDKTIGYLSMLITSDARRYNSEDRPFLFEVARRAAVAIENAALFKMANRAIQLRDEFISLASHEIKTPLTSLKLHLQMGRRLPKYRVATTFDKADNQVDRLSKLVDDMLDISRIALNKLPLEPEKVDLANLTREVVERVEPQITSTGSTVRLDAKEPVIGYWDKYRIEQIIINLLTNAAKYGKGKPIEVAVARENGSAKLRVKDSGIGIAKADQERIFQRFERAAELGIGGLGLGLYIAKQIVEAHNGSIRVESEPHKGSTFEVTLALNP